MQAFLERCQEKTRLRVRTLCVASLLDQLHLLQLLVRILDETAEHRTRELLRVIEGAYLLWLLNDWFVA